MRDFVIAGILTFSTFIFTLGMGYALHKLTASPTRKAHVHCLMQLPLPNRPVEVTFTERGLEVETLLGKVELVGVPCAVMRAEEEK